MLKDEDVCIDRHTDRENDARHARQRQRRIHQIKDAEQHDRICHECHVRDKARKMVEENHEEHDRTESDHKRELGFVLRVLSERRADRARLDDLNLHGQRAAAQDDREVLRLLKRLLPRDLRTPAEDRLTHIRRGQHLTIEQNGNRTPDVLHREVGKFLCALIRELQVDDVLPRLRIRRCLCILQIRTREHRMPLFVAELKHRSLADRSDRSIGILDARQFDDDATLPLALNDRLGQSERVDSLLHDGDHAVHRIVVDLRLLRVDRLQNDVRSALQVKSLPNRARERLNQEKKRADDDHNRNHQL